jgi:hypothetical protein
VPFYLRHSKDKLSLAKVCYVAYKVLLVIANSEMDFSDIGNSVRGNLAISYPYAIGVL